MAHFAELDSNNKVLRVVVVGNDCVPSDEHVDGEKWCISFFKGGTWKQTSYNGKFRCRYAGKSAVYDPVNDVFYGQQPHASWTLNTETWRWDPPVAAPTMEQSQYTHSDGNPGTYRLEWSEANQQWIGFGEENAQFEWDPDTSSWNATGG